jgi:hypothetical protein
MRAQDNSPTTLFELLSGPRHTLLLFPGAWHGDRSWHGLIDLAESVKVKAGDLINTFFVVIEPGTVPSNPHLDERLILDPERSLYYRYGAESECLYLIRPDGYVGYRSEPATNRALHNYLERIFL